MSAELEGPVSREEVDVVIVGSRLAGPAAAVAFSRAGRRALVLDRASFPSGTLSTHIMSAGAVNELKRVGGLERALATGAPKLPIWSLRAAGPYRPRGRYRRVEGVDFGLCVRREGLDAALNETARAEGAEVRERSTVKQLVWAGGRAAGIRYEDAEGNLREVRARLVVGADGRHSTVARLLGVERPYRRWWNGRGMVFRYFDDPAPESERMALSMWRFDDLEGFLFPTYDGSLCLLQPPVEEIKLFRADPEGMWELALAKVPPLRERLEGCTPQGKIRIAPDDLSSYFRISTGPGWALVGDAGHFKDPIIGQGMHDGLRFGRRLGELAADVLEDERELDARLYRWELERDHTVMPSVYFAGGRLARREPLTGVEMEMCKQLDQDREFASLAADYWARRVGGREMFTWRRRLAWGSRALRRPGASAKEGLLVAYEEARLDAQLAWERLVLRSGRRVRAGRWLAWGRNGWDAGLAPGGMLLDEREPRAPWHRRKRPPPGGAPPPGDPPVATLPREASETRRAAPEPKGVRAA
jgi:flavin-dependent dehydrogenase